MAVDARLITHEILDAGQERLGHHTQCITNVIYTIQLVLGTNQSTSSLVIMVRTCD